MLQFLVSSNCIELRSKDRVFQQNHHCTTTTVSTFPPLPFISQKEVVMQHMDRIAKKIRIHTSHQIIDLTQHLTIFTSHWKAPKWSVHTAVKSAWLLFHLETSNLFLFLDFCFLVSIVFWNMIESGVGGDIIWPFWNYIDLTGGMKKGLGVFSLSDKRLIAVTFNASFWTDKQTEEYFDGKLEVWYFTDLPSYSATAAPLEPGLFSIWSLLSV